MSIIIWLKVDLIKLGSEGLGESSGRDFGLALQKPKEIQGSGTGEFCEALARKDQQSDFPIETPAGHFTQEK